MNEGLIKTLIVDDEPLARDLLASLIEMDPSLQLVGTSRDGGEALADISRLKPDLVFLDVQMPVLDGVGVVDRLLHRRHMPHIVFVTAFDQYAVKAFELNVLDYILKPIEKERFYPTVNRAKQAIRQKKIVDLAQRMLGVVSAFREEQVPPAIDENSFLINTGKRLVTITADDIIWVEAANQYVRVHTETESYLMSENLRQFTAKLNDTMFLRAHRSATINVSKVVSVARKGSGAHRISLAGGHSVVLSRGRAAHLPLLLNMSRLNASSMAGLSPISG